MQSKGWCFHKLDNLFEAFRENPGVLSYINQLDWTQRRLLDHSPCSKESTCVANSVDMDNYPTQHTDPNCNCKMIGADYEKVVKIIEKGQIPLISIQTNNGDISLSVEPRRYSSRYIAISHVWADGLGNPKENALPECQLRRLKNYLDNLPVSRENPIFNLGPYTLDPLRLRISKSAHNRNRFWMDTLCIPVKNEHEHLRNKSIAQMAMIYALCVQVLVLDKTLDRSVASSTEVLARILCSSWMERSWTLQEGYLGTECVYQFVDFSLSPMHEWNTSGDQNYKTSSTIFSTPQGEEKRIFRELYKSLWNKLLAEWSMNRKGKARWRNFLDPNESPAHFMQSWNELAIRSTTYAQDTHLILGNLLGFKMNFLECQDEETIMETIFTAHTWTSTNLPMSILFNNGRRVKSTKDHKNRWVPAAPSRYLLKNKMASLSIRIGHNGMRINRIEQEKILVALKVMTPTTISTITVGNTSAIIQVHHSCLESDEFNFEKYWGTCLILETPVLTPGMRCAAALCYVSCKMGNWKIDQRDDDPFIKLPFRLHGPDMTLVYHSPVFIYVPRLTSAQQHVDNIKGSDSTFWYFPMFSTFWHFPMFSTAVLGYGKKTPSVVLLIYLDIPIEPPTQFSHSVRRSQRNTAIQFKHFYLITALSTLSVVILIFVYAKVHNHPLTLSADNGVASMLLSMSFMIPLVIFLFSFVRRYDPIYYWIWERSFSV
jgi:Heterokaryon incompatibility protein (HET)